MTRAPRRPHLPLQLKLTAALVLIVITPLAAASYMVDQLGRTAANVASSEAEARLKTMIAARDSYRRIVEYTLEVAKGLQSEIAQRLALRRDLRALDPRADLAQVLAEEHGLRAIAIVRADGAIAASAERPASGSTSIDKVVEQPLDDAGATLRLTFQVPPVNDDLRNQQDAIRSTQAFMQIRDPLADSYRTAFLVVLGISGLAAAGFGFWASSFVTRRLTALVATARKISDGQLDARVELRGHDELAELGGAFNTMLDDLDQTRTQLQYLQRMGVWQDVARRLAHEIKNPLTPIQLAVQQCVSSYAGDDARYRNLLRDTGEIVEEEIAALRRLVDTFRTLGALPKVEKAPIELADVIDELSLDPAMAGRLTLQPPDQPVTVRADKLLLKRVLANLVENGIHAGQEAGSPGDVVISWAADPRRDVVTITVDDHGRGVGEANRD
jgi:nitrogen fixation/metabolism regulation signal transduction histidine kinase